MCCVRVKLLRYGKPVATIFDLLGTREDDMTYSLGYVASRSQGFLEGLLRLVTGIKVAGVGEATVRLQTRAAAEHGRTDVEIHVGAEAFVVIEAKRGPWLPSEAQLRRYVPILDREEAMTKRLVAVTNATDDLAAAILPKTVLGVPLVHVSWRAMKNVAHRARADESSHRNKRLLDEFTTYLGGILGMESIRSNMVLVVVLNNEDAWGVRFKEVVLRQRRYFDPVARHQRHGPPNYLGFRYDGRLQSIHHVERTEMFTNPKSMFPRARAVTVEPHYLFHLGPAIVPTREVKNGAKVMQAFRRRCMIDTLLTCATITDAVIETRRRLGSEAADVLSEDDGA